MTPKQTIEELQQRLKVIPARVKGIEADVKTIEAWLKDNTKRLSVVSTAQGKVARGSQDEKVLKSAVVGLRAFDALLHTDGKSREVVSSDFHALGKKIEAFLDRFKGSLPTPLDAKDGAKLLAEYIGISAAYDNAPPKHRTAAVKAFRSAMSPAATKLIDWGQNAKLATFP